MLLGFFFVFLFIVFFNLFDGTNVDNSVKHDLMDTTIICHFLPKSRLKDSPTQHSKGLNR